MQALLVEYGLSHWKAVIGALLMPPASPLLLALLGALLALRWRRLGRGLVALGLVAGWLLACPGTGHLLLVGLNPPPPPLGPAQVAALRGAPRTAVLVLGAGRKVLAPEYGQADLRPLTLERLRYGVWLVRQTGLPLGYSGGVGHGSAPGLSEAAAVKLALQRDQGPPLRWLEDRARDTDENARYSVALLRADGITQVVLVTHGAHQPRALAAFRRAIERQGASMHVLPAPVGLEPPIGWHWGDWVPSADGVADSAYALHEWLGRLAGA